MNAFYISFFIFGLRMVVAEGCAFAHKHDNQPQQRRTKGYIDSRRAVYSATNVLPAKLLMQYGATYPHGVKGHVAGGGGGGGAGWKTRPTPPTLYYPMGSSTRTVTLHPFILRHTEPWMADICHYEFSVCIKAFGTGSVCAVAMFELYYTYKDYCSLNFANCKLKAIVWRLAWFGSCSINNFPDNLEEFNLEADTFMEAAVINPPPFNPLTGRQESFYMDT